MFLSFAISYCSTWCLFLKVSALRDEWLHEKSIFYWFLSKFKTCSDTLTDMYLCTPEIQKPEDNKKEQQIYFKKNHYF